MAIDKLDQEFQAVQRTTQRALGERASLIRCSEALQASMEVNAEVHRRRAARSCREKVRDSVELALNQQRSQLHASMAEFQRYSSALFVEVQKLQELGGRLGADLQKKQAALQVDKNT